MVSDAEIETLSREEQISLLERLLIVIADDVSTLTEAERRDIDARLAAIKSNPNDMCSWDEFRRTLSDQS